MPFSPGRDARPTHDDPPLFRPALLRAALLAALLLLGALLFDLVLTGTLTRTPSGMLSSRYPRFRDGLLFQEAALRPWLSYTGVFLLGLTAAPCVWVERRARLGTVGSIGLTALTAFAVVLVVFFHVVYVNAVATTLQLSGSLQPLDGLRDAWSSAQIQLFDPFSMLQRFGWFPIAFVVACRAELSREGLARELVMAVLGTAILAGALLYVASDPERQGFVPPPPAPPTVIRLPEYLVHGIGIVCFAFSLYTAAAVVAARHAASALERGR